LGAVKGVGEAAVASIVEERERNGLFKDIFDLMGRVNLRSANKKTFESLIMAGAFDAFGYTRAQYFATENGKDTFLEALIKYGNGCQSVNSQSVNSLFGEAEDNSIPKPKAPKCPAWSRIELINKEKDVAGFYISGHPLDDFKFDIENFCTHKVSELSDVPDLKGKEISFAGLVIGAMHLTAQNGNGYGNFTIEDFSGNINLRIFKDDYLKWKHFLVPGTFLYLKAKTMPNYKNPEIMEIKPTQIMLLSEVREKMAKSLTIRIPLKGVSDDMVKNIYTITSTHPGNCTLKFTLVDPDENMSVDLVAKKIKLQLSNDLIRQLDAMASVSYKLN